RGGDSSGPTGGETVGSDCGWPPYRPYRRDESQHRALLDDLEVGLTPLNRLKGRDSRCDSSAAVSHGPIQLRRSTPVSASRTADYPHNCRSAVAPREGFLRE